MDNPHSRIVIADFQIKDWLYDFCLRLVCQLLMGRLQLYFEQTDYNSWNLVEAVHAGQA